MPFLIRLSLVTLAFVSSRAFATGMNDVSVLLPLPKMDTEVREMIRPEPRDQKKFFALSILNELADPDSQSGRQSGNQFSSKQDLMWRLIAVRLDPCFFETGAPNACRHQIRLIWQPLFKHNQDWLTRDQAVHTFYDFSPREWKLVLRDWATHIPQTSRDLPLAIHPLIQREGYFGPTWIAMRAVLQRHCDESHLTRVTASFANNIGTVWTFSGINIDVNGNHERIDIAKTPSKTQQQEFSADLNELGEFFSRISPAPLNEDFFTSLVRHSVGARATMNDSQMFEALSRPYEFENPRRTNPGNTDCVSCHIAQTVRLWGTRHFPKITASSFGEIDFTSSQWNLANGSPNASFPNRVRAFGYFLEEPAISQRVINETAHVLEGVDLLGTSAVDADHSSAVRSHL